MADNKNKTAPTQSLMDKLLGRQPADPEFDRRLELAKQAMQREMPNEMAQANIKPVGIIGGMVNRLLPAGGNPVATTNPLGSITYNPTLLKQLSQPEMEDVLAHELTHVKQYMDKPLVSRLLSSVLPQRDEGLPEETVKSLRMQGWENPAEYRGKSYEMEAYDAEAQRKLRTGRGEPGYDIQLFPAKKTGPSSQMLKKMVK